MTQFSNLPEGNKILWQREEQRQCIVCSCGIAMLVVLQNIFIVFIREFLLERFHREKITLCNKKNRNKKSSGTEQQCF